MYGDDDDDDVICQECDEWELEGPRYIVALIVLLHSMNHVLARERRDLIVHDSTAVTLARAVIERSAQ